MSENQRLFDAGLQPERTALAWRRTALSLGIGSLVALRLLPEALGHLAWALIGIAGVMGAALVWWSSRRQYTAFYRAQTRNSSYTWDAWPMAVLASSTLLLGLAALALALVVFRG